jgi:N6-adenosine-specific RNA methylase IME4
MKRWPFKGLNLHGYSVIYLDPPWTFETYSAKGEGRSAKRHYQTMSLKEIAELPVKYLARRDCVMLCWVTMPMLPQALQVIKGWGFTYKTVAFTWMKKNPKTKGLFFGNGYWTRSNAELCILATRGKPKRVFADVPQAILAPVREHSRKPDEIYERIERLLDGKYLELFARTTRQNWHSWGLETDKF